MELETRSALDMLYEELRQRDVPFQAPPREYPWNACCAYFTDPDDTLWSCMSGGTEAPVTITKRLITRTFKETDMSNTRVS